MPDQSQVSPSGRADTKAMLSPAAIQEQIEALNQVASHPAVISAMKELAELPEEERLDAARRLATPEALRDRGASLPEGFRITTRYFEEPGASIQNQVKLGEIGAPSVLDELERKAPEALAAMRRSRPEMVEELGGLGVPEAAGLTVCLSAGTWVCVSVGGNT
jgi:hypothetical protein